MLTIKNIEKEILVIIISNVHHWKSTDKVTKAELLKLKKELRILTIQKMKDLALELAGEFQKLIAEEINIARQETPKTSRLTSLSIKIDELDFFKVLNNQEIKLENWQIQVIKVLIEDKIRDGKDLEGIVSIEGLKKILEHPILKELNK